jgi:alkyldihydroxyacetonephosphate synthase
MSVDLVHLDRVAEVDDVSLAARIGAGARGPVLQAQLGEHGLAFRHYPQSYEFSTLGGWIATRAGGHFATGRTRIDDFVESVRMLTPTGWYESRRLPGSGAGPSPDATLALGSEGTLGLITEAWVRIQRPPRHRAKASVKFATFIEGARAVRALAQSELYPSNCRLIDPLEARLNSVTTEPVAVLLLAFESADHPLDAWLARALEIVADHGGEVMGTPRVESKDQEQHESDRWKSSFFQAPYLQNVLVSLGVIADTFETACTWDKFEAFDREVRGRVTAAMKDVAGDGKITCRLTHAYPDGAAPYYTFLAPARVGAELEQWAAIKAAASDAIIDLGGTITHHHAVGRVHRDAWERQRPERYAAALEATKRALDPSGILNPGVLLASTSPRENP